MRNFKQLIASLVLTFSVFGLHAQEAKDGKSLLWKISGKDLKYPSYVYGTIHVICEDDFYLEDLVDEKFEETSRLVLEIDLSSPNTQAVMMQNAYMTDGSNMRMLLDSATFAKTNRYFIDSVGFNLDQIGMLRPFMLTAMLYPKLVGCTPVAYEQYFMDKAKELEIPITGIERIEDQLEIFEKIPYKDQAKSLADMVANMKQARKEFASLLAVYKSQDIQKAAAMIKESEEYKDFEDIMLTNRNKNWIAPMIKHMKETPTFFAFGAAHLGGEEGVLNLLKAKGYTVTPLREQE